MAGHSKWANIQHRKGRQDAKRGAMFTKAAKEIIIAAKGGGDPAGNSRLRAAIAAAKAINLPKDKIETAIRKGTGAEAGGELFELNYEGYGPSGIAFIVETATDNKNRTVSEIRHLFSRAGGNLGETGSVSWMFDRKGIILIDKSKYSEEQIMEAALEAGAEDVVENDDNFEVTTSLEDFSTVRDTLEEAQIEMESAELSYIAQNTITVDKEVAEKLIKFVDNLEDNDDVQKVHANFELPDDFE